MYNTKSYEKSRSRLASFGNGKSFVNTNRSSSNNGYPSYPEVEVPVMLKRTSSDTYKFPKYDSVPAGVYHSEIKSAKGIISTKGKPSIEVCYALKEVYKYCGIVQGDLAEDTPIETYNIKQVYPEDSKHYKKFVAAMAKTLKIKNELEDIRVDRVIGVTELVELAYNLDSDYGQIVARKPFYEEWIAAAAAAAAEDEDTVEEDSDAEDASCHEEDYCAEEDFDDEDDDYLEEED